MRSRVKFLEETNARLLQEGDRILESAEGRRLTAKEKARLDEIKGEVKANKEDIKTAQEWSNEDKEAVAKVAGQKKADEKGDSFKGLGEFLQAVYNAGRSGGQVDPRLVYQAASGTSEGVSSDGGYLVRQDISDELFRLAHETGVLSSKCRTLPISSDANGITINAVDETSRATGSRWGGIRAYWVAEAAAATASKPKFRQINLKLQKLAGLMYATDELLKDQAALESVATEGFAEEFGFTLDDAIFRGDGAGKPLGIINSGALVSVAKETGQAANTFLYENVTKMVARCWARSFPSAVWYINQAVYPQLFQMSLPIGTAGVPVYLPPTGAAGAPFGTLFGRPVQPIEQASALGTQGDVVLADLSQYVLAEKGGLETAMSIHVKFVEDETTFRWILRVDGQPIWRSALTPYKGSDTLSPFVTLDTRA